MRSYRPDLRWLGLLPGLFAIVSMSAAAFHVATRVGLGNLPGEKFTFYAVTNQARGILRGSDVWLSGQRVGAVSDVRFLQPTLNSEEHVLLELEVLASHRDLLRGDTKAQLGTGSRLIGNPVVHLRLGSITEPPLQSGDTIGMLPQFDADIALSRVELAIVEYPAIARDFREVLESASGVDSVLRRILTDDPQGGGTAGVRQLLLSVQSLRERLASGSIGSLMRDSLLGPQLQAARNSTDSLMLHYNINNSAAALLLGESGVLAQMTVVAGELRNVINMFNVRVNDLTEGQRAMELQGELDRLTDRLRALQSDVRRNPFRYIVF